MTHDMERANAVETTPLLIAPQQQQHRDNNNKNDCPADYEEKEKESTTIPEPSSDQENPGGDDEPLQEKEKSHLKIFLTALWPGVFGGLMFWLLYPVLLWLVMGLFWLLFSVKGVEDRNNEYGLHPVTFGFMMFFG